MLGRNILQICSRSHSTLLQHAVPTICKNLTQLRCIQHTALRWMSNKPQQQQQQVDHVPSYYDRYVFPEPPDLVTEQEHDIVVSKVNEAIASPDVGRLFAIIQIGGKQYKITNDDLIRVDSYLPADIGERIRLEKVLLCGGQDFTLVGRPLLRRSLVKVEATIIEKTPGFEKIMQYFRKLRFKRKKIYTPKHTVIRINSIEASPSV